MQYDAVMCSPHNTKIKYINKNEFSDEIILLTYFQMPAKIVHNLAYFDGCPSS